MNDKHNINENARVLVVDDEQMIRKIFSKYLKDMKFSVDTANDGLEALEKLSQNEFDIVLTDLNMPKMSGRELLQNMSEQYPNIPKIVLTGFGTHDDIILALKTGAYDFITKPITDFNILKHAINRAIERKRLNDEKNRLIAQLTQINEVISMLNSGKSTTEVFEALNITLKKIIPYNRISLATINKDENIVITKMVKSDKELILLNEGDKISLENSSLQSVAKKKEVLYIDDLKEYLKNNPNSKSTKMLIDEGYNSTLVLPLIANNQTRGFLIFSSDIVKAFQKEHITFLELIVGQISLSIQRGELLFEVEQHTRNLEHLVEERTKQVLKTQKTTVFALSSLAETRDPETGLHLERMRNYSIFMAQLLKYIGKYTEINSQYIRDLYDSSILHDIGKVGIPDGILLKKGKLSDEEFSVMKTHTTIGNYALKTASKNLGRDSFLNMAMDVTKFHHENWKGNGYHDNLKGDEIPLSARIVAIADVYDALSSDRPYKMAFSHEKSLAIMQEESHKFDPNLFKVFVDNSDEFNKIRIKINEAK